MRETAQVRTQGPCNVAPVLDSLRDLGIRDPQAYLGWGTTRIYGSGDFHPSG